MQAQINRKRKRTSYPCARKYAPSTMESSSGEDESEEERSLDMENPEEETAYTHKKASPNFYSHRKSRDGIRAGCARKSASLTTASDPTRVEDGSADSFQHTNEPLKEARYSLKNSFTPYSSHTKATKRIVWGTARKCAPSTQASDPTSVKDGSADSFLHTNESLKEADYSLNSFTPYSGHTKATKRIAWRTARKCTPSTQKPSPSSSEENESDQSVAAIEQLQAQKQKLEKTHCFVTELKEENQELTELNSQLEDNLRILKAWMKQKDLLTGAPPAILKVFKYIPDSASEDQCALARKS